MSKRDTIAAETGGNVKLYFAILPDGNYILNHNATSYLFGSKAALIRAAIDFGMIEFIEVMNKLRVKLGIQKPMLDQWNRYETLNTHNVEVSSLEWQLLQLEIHTDARIISGSSEYEWGIVINGRADTTVRGIAPFRALKSVPQEMIKKEVKATLSKL